MSINLNAQQITLSSQVTNEIVVNGTSGDMTIEVVNGSASSLTNVSFTISLETGMTYESGSLQSNSGHAVAEIDVSNNQNLTFSAQNVPVGDTLNFKVGIIALCDAIHEQLQGTVFRNNITLNHDGGSANVQTNAYNILYASLSILSTTPKNHTISSGSSYDRTIQIINGGNGRINSFYLVDNHLSELNIESVNLGTLNATKDTLFFSAVDFLSVGNNDGYLDQNESINVTESVSGTSCSDATITSYLRAGWKGIDGNECQYHESVFNTTVDYEEPQISLTSSDAMSYCFGSAALNQQSLTLTNTGEGKAVSIVVDIFKSSNGSSYNQDLLSKFETGNVTYSLNGGATQSIAASNILTTRNDGDYACLGANPKGGFTLTFSELDENDEIVIYWDATYCPLASCNSPDVGGWAADISYSDVCSGNNYSGGKTGQSTYNSSMALFSESQPDIQDGATLPFTYTISSYSNDFDEDEPAYLLVHFNLEAGLQTANDAISWTSSTTTWNPYSVTYNSGTGDLYAKFALPAPFDLPKSEIMLDISGNCSGVSSGNKDILLNIDYIPDSTCATPATMPLICDFSNSTYLICPINCSEGLESVLFSAQRSSFGLVDNDDNGIADASGNLIFSKIKLNRLMVGDTLHSTFKGIVNTSPANTTWQYAKIETTIPQGVNFSALDATLIVYDQSAGSTINCSGLNPVLSGSGTVQFAYDLSPSALQSACPAFTGITYAQGDSLLFTANYELSGNIGAAVSEVTIDNDFYVTNEASPTAEDKYACGMQLENITLIGYEFIVNKKNNVTVNSCTKNIQQSFYFGVGDCCSNYGGGNLFPFEYRHWSIANEIKTVIPAGYTYVDSWIKQFRTAGTNNTSTQTIYFSPTRIGDTLYFNVDSLYEDNGGSLKHSDDGYSGTMYVKVAPSCDVTSDVWLDMPWYINFTKTSWLDGGNTSFYHIDDDRLKFSPTNLVLTADNPVEDGIARTVEWHVNIRNNTSKTHASNSWLHLVSPDGDVVIKAVIEESSGDTIVANGDIYRLGTINKNTTKSYIVSAYYHACTPENLVVFAGYECDGYPANYADFTCPHSNMTLQVIPKPAQTQVQLAGSTYLDDCNNEIEVEVKVQSVQLAHTDSIKINMQVPASGSITNTNASSELKYPADQSYMSVTDPSFANNTYHYDVMNLNNDLFDDGLPGVYQTDKNTLYLKTRLQLENNYLPGDFVGFNIQSKNVCGDDLPAINLAFDPSFSFSKVAVPGITGNENNWSVSWGDYNSDGYDDIFITNYDVNMPNTLYENNTDGTFTKVTTGAIVTDLASSLASSWGDYDNDGDLDLFVANNKGTSNFLYKNNGDETFDKITTGHIVNYDGYCHGATWGDFNNDGYLDLFVADFMPTKFNLLYKNNGDGTFTLLEETPVSTDANYSIGASWADYDNDGDADLFVPNVNDYDYLYQNSGNGKFVKVTNAVTAEQKNSVGSSWGDYDNDGDLDLFVAHAGNQDNDLFQNNGDGSFTKITSGVVVSDRGNSHGSAWGDYDNDGDLDLFVTNDRNEVNFFYANNGDGTFTKLNTALDEDMYNSFGTAWSDFDRDGDLDLFVVNHSNQANHLYTNSKGKCSAYTCVELVGNQSNKTGIGARISVTATINGQSVTQIRDISAQTGGGSGSQNTILSHFGLGDATNIDEIKVKWPSGVVQTLTNRAPNSCYTIEENNGSLVCGTVYYDTDGDCVKDAGESLLPNQQIKITPGPQYTYTNENGQFSTYLSDGNYTLEIIDGSVWSGNCGAQDSKQVNVSGGGANSYCGLDFGMQPSCSDPDIQVQIHTSLLRRGFENEYIVNVTNQGGTVANAVDLSITFPSNIHVDSTSLAYENVVGNSYNWHFASINIGEWVSFNIIDSVDLGVSIGDTLEVTATLNYAQNDCDTTNNSIVDRNAVMGAVDPNDKQVWPFSEDNNKVSVKDGLTYKIRFQNVGSYMASTVVVIDTLSEYLDPLSIENMFSSHNYSMEQINGHILKWTFNNINLPTETDNEPGSHGFVQFTVHPIEDFENGTEIDNVAYIKFDYEAVISTNYVNSKIAQPQQYELLDPKIDIYPNPSQDYINLALFNDEEHTITKVDILDANGRLIETIIADTKSLSLNITALESGIYIFRITDNYNRQFQKRVARF